MTINKDGSVDCGFIKGAFKIKPKPEAPAKPAEERLNDDYVKGHFEQSTQGKR